jgi:uncharacterized protein (TIGR02145 family)
MRLLAWLEYGRTLLLTAALIALSVGTAAAQKGTVADGRDGRKYRTVKIGNQTWMAENLNYQTDSGSWCYNNSADSCENYGRLYDWNTAKTVCPAGWKLPSRQEWNVLASAAGGGSKAGKKLKARSGWCDRGNGTDDYGFSALPGGRRYSGGRSGSGFSFVGYNGYLWTAEEENDSTAYYRDIYCNDIKYSNVLEDYDYKSNGLSVRCIKE